MNIPQIQSQLALNRCFLSSFHHDLTVAKYALKSGCDFSEYWKHELKSSRKQINRLANLQKSLKFDLACIIEKQRRSREIIKQNEVRVNAMIMAGECV